MENERPNREIDKVKIGLIVILLVSIFLFYVEYMKVKSELDDLKDLVEKYKRVPAGYYETDSFNDLSNRLSQLEDFLAHGFKLPTGYKMGEWDCSESSAYLEWALEDAGFDASMVVGQAPWDPRVGYHAWIIVYTEEYSGTHMQAIEPTALTGGLTPALQYLLFNRAPGIIYRGDKYEDGYYQGYDKRYKNIYWAIEDYGSIEEWDWWSGYWESPRSE